MRSMFRNVLVAIVAVLALSAVASATASAALPEIVNSKGEALIKKKFTGEVKGTKGGEGTLTLHCSGGCHTKGLKEKEMKFPVSVNLVWLSKAKEEAALLLSIPGVADFEGYCWSDTMPSQFPLEVSGSLLIRVSPTNKLGTEYRFLVKQKNGR